jgi:hypothetical protein
MATTDDGSLVWAAYATGIAAMTGISSLSLSSTQRFAIALQNDFALPSTLYVQPATHRDI